MAGQYNVLTTNRICHSVCVPQITNVHYQRQSRPRALPGHYLLYPIDVINIKLNLSLSIQC